MTFNVVAILVVAAMVVGAVGVAVFDGLLSRGEDKPLSIDAEQMDQTEKTYRDAIAANPRNFEAMSALAGYLANEGNIQEAITWYERALEIVPDDMDTRLRFAGDLADAGKQSDAELQYLKVIEVEPDNAFALLGFARLYRSWSPPRPDDAVTYYKLAIERAGVSVVRDQAQEELAALTGTPVAPLAASPGASPSPAP